MYSTALTSDKSAHSKLMLKLYFVEYHVVLGQIRTIRSLSTCIRESSSPPPPSVHVHLL